MTKADDFLTYVSRELGKPYVYGDEGPNTFDCSGLVQYCLGLVGISIPRTAAQQQKATTPVTTPVPGDLVFYGNPAHHVAIYVGGGKQIAAPHTGAVVSLQNVSSGATYRRVSALGASSSAIFTPVADGLATTVGALFPTAKVRSLVIEAIAVSAGLALLGYGIFKTVIKPQAAKAIDAVGSIL